MLTPPYQILAPDGTVEKPADLIALDFSQGDFISLYTLLLKGRLFYRKEAALATLKKMKLSIYGEGQEAEVGSVFAAAKMGLKPLLSYYARNHAPALLRISPKDLLLANIFYNTLPESLVDLFIQEKVEVPSTGVAYNITRAVGMAWALGETVIVYFGDGASAEPEFSSGINWACIWNVPTLFYCENNGIAISTPTANQMATHTIAEKAKGIGGDKLYVELVDGDDVLATYAATKRTLEYICRSGLPAFLETLTYRRGKHTNVIDGRIILTDKERRVHEEAMARDPLVRFQRFLLSPEAEKFGVFWTNEDDTTLRKKVEQEIDECARAALSEAERIESNGKEEVYAVEIALNTPSRAKWDETAAREIERSEVIKDVTALDALAIATRDAIKLFRGKFKAFGHDIGRHAGVMRNWGIHIRHLPKMFPKERALGLEKLAYLNYLALQELYPDSIIDATLDESGMAGVALGYAQGGRQTVIEPQFSGFFMPMLYQLDEAGRLYQHYRGKLPIPLTLMMLYGSGEKIERHNEDESDDISRLLGWTVACPYTVQGYYSLTLAKIISNRPGAIFAHLEHLRSLHGSLRRGIPLHMIEDFDIELVQDGKDVTLVTYGALVQKAIEATKPKEIDAAYQRRNKRNTERKPTSTKILALQLLPPPRIDLIIDSVETTGRLLVVQEGSTSRQRLGAEIVQRVAGDWRSFEYLKSPTHVLGGRKTYPQAPQLEKYRTPQVEDIADAIIETANDNRN